MKLKQLLEESAAVQKLREKWRQEVEERNQLPILQPLVLAIAPDGTAYASRITMSDFDRRYIQR
jgi:hypothetical protein